MALTVGFDPRLITIRVISGFQRAIPKYSKILKINKSERCSTKMTERSKEKALDKSASAKPKKDASQHKM